MTLKILLPERVVLHETVDKVVAEGGNGSFGLLPRHIDFVAPLVPGILSYTQDGEEAFVAVDEGVLVKCGGEVLVSVRDAVLGPSLESLEETVRTRFDERRDQERVMHSALAKLEAEVVRRFMELR
ncbi:F0F1 ATP synthase subunit epsilon [Salinibacter sp. 10B]|uniref:F0F1 ATP synthase subunit epsilon n=1 Tax=Salinibacter sp. 10B TaxID=1923971 RepID=UPI000CF53C0B|nr:F0F1 ATP synthase subunit epsilon [Salinibacter sp. 10B]PQJ35215.1 F0F1 ATP synthase subunit epsilon [Salinibacter sp. 10B]